MHKTRSTRQPKASRRRLNYETLEARLVLSGSYILSTTDQALANTSAAGAAPQPGSSYTLRYLIDYYDNYWNSTSPFIVPLTDNTTYHINAINTLSTTNNQWSGRLDTLDLFGDLDVYNGNHASKGPLILQAPTSASIVVDQVAYGTSSLLPVDRAFHVLSGAQLELQNVNVSGGLALDNGYSQTTDALGGGVLVDSGATLTLLNSAIKSNVARGTTGIAGTSLENRHGAGFNSAGGGIYGAAGSQISIDSTSQVTNNYAFGGRGAKANGSGGLGGGAYGAGIAVNAPASPSLSDPTSLAIPAGTPSTILNLDAGAIIQNNAINLASKTGLYFPLAKALGTGGSGSGNNPVGGNGGPALGGGLYMSSGELNLDALSGGNPGNLAVSIVGNTATAGSGKTGGATAAGSNGVVEGAGSYLAPGLVNVQNWSTSNQSVTVPNFGFETPAQNSYVYNPINANWTFTGDTGVSANNSGFTSGNANAPQGSQVAFIQSGNGQASGASITQTLTGLTPGEAYKVGFYSAMRGGYPQQSFQVTENGISLGIFSPNTTYYTRFSTAPFIAPANGNVTLSFIGMNPNNTDETDFIDNVTVTLSGILYVPNGGDLYIPTVNYTDIDTGYTSFNGQWNLRTAVSAMNALVSTGMTITLNLPGQPLSLTDVNPPTITNNSFESPAIAAATTAAFTGVQANWSYSTNSGIGAAGITSNGSSLGATSAPQGSQVAYIQGGGGISQTLTGFSPGRYYNLTFQAEGSAQASVNLSLDGLSIGTFTPGSGSFQFLTSAPFSPSSGSHVLTFTGLSPNNNGSAIFIDNLQITEVASTSAPTIQNASFETPSQSGVTNHYTSQPSGAAWTFSASSQGSSGITGNSSTYTVPNIVAPFGSQAAYLVGNGALSQTLNNFIAGDSYVVSLWAAMGSGTPPESFQVTIDGVAIETFTPSSTAYQQFTTIPFSAGGGNHTLAFVGLNTTTSSGADLIDGVSISQTNTGSLAVTNSPTGGLLKIVGAGESSTFIYAVSLNSSAFVFSGAAVSLSNLTISGASSTGNGGAVNAINSVVTMTGVSIKSNTASLTANGLGGGIYQSGGSLNLNNTTIKNNNAVSGGGLYLDSNSTLTMAGGSVSNNTSTNLGGAIDAQNSAITLTSATVTGNSSPGNGGAIYGVGDNITLSNSNVQSNTSSANGGAFFISGNSKLKVNGGSISSNAAGGNGAGIDAQVSSGGNPLLKLNTVNVSGNTAGTGNGGGLYFESTGSLRIGNSKFLKNLALSGGGLYLNVGSASLTGMGISSNKASGTGNSGLGGGIYQSGGTLLLANDHLLKNTSNVGGGAYFTGSTTTLNGGTIQANTAATNGGGVNSQNNTLNFTNVSVASNVVGTTTNLQGGGGGLYQNGGGSVHLNGTTVFKGNAAQTGGGIWSGNGLFVVKGTQFLANKAVLDGAGFYSTGNSSTMNFTSASVFGNTINGTSSGSNTGAGAGMWLSGSALNFTAKKLKIKKNAISGTASQSMEGAGLYVSGTAGMVLNLTNVTVSSNAIGACGVSSGAGLYLSGGSLNTKSFSVSNNSITTTNNQLIQGAGIFATGSKIAFNGGSSGTVSISGNKLIGNGGGTAYGAGILATGGTSVAVNAAYTLSNNTISQTTNGVGGGIAFFSNSSYSITSGLSTSISGDTATAGGNVYAFTVTDTNDNNNVTTYSDPSGINYFTSGTGSLRSAVSFCQNYMAATANNISMAIILSGSSYSLSSSYGELTVNNLPTGDLLTIICEGSTPTSQATIQGSGAARDFFLAGNGSVALQNLYITGGYANTNDTNGYNYEGGGIFLATGTLTLTATTIAKNTAIATAPGATGANHTGTRTVPGGAGSAGNNAYGGGLYMNSGTILYLNSNCSITQNTAQASMGGKGGHGGIGYESDTEGGDCDGHNGGVGGAGGTGGSAYGGGLYQAGGTIYTPASNSASVIFSNTETTASGGAGGSGGQSGNDSGDSDCGWGSNGGGPTGASGTAYSDFNTNNNSGVVYNSAPSAQSIGITASSTGRSLPLAGVRLELHAADGRLISSATTNNQGMYTFPTTFSGMGYLEAYGLTTHRISPLGTIASDGSKSSFDPATGRTSIIQFLAGQPVNTHISLVMLPNSVVFRTGPNYVQLFNNDTKQVVWRDKLEPSSYSSGFTYAAIDIDGDGTNDFVVIPRKGPATPFVVDGRSGHFSRIGGTIAPVLATGVTAILHDVTGDPAPELILAPSNSRSGNVSVIDLKEKKVLWNSTSYVKGGMTVSFASSYMPLNGAAVDVVLSSLTRDLKSPSYAWQRWINGTTGKVVETEDPLPTGKKDLEGSVPTPTPTPKPTKVTHPKRPASVAVHAQHSARLHHS